MDRSILYEYIKGQMISMVINFKAELLKDKSDIGNKMNNQAVEKTQDIIAVMERRQDEKYRNDGILDWKQIIYTEGELDEKKVMNELHDFEFVMSQASLVYEHVAGLSKTNYFADVIIKEHDEKFLSKGITQDDIKKMFETSKSFADLKEDVFEYLEIKQ